MMQIENKRLVEALENCSNSDKAILSELVIALIEERDILDGIKALNNVVANSIAKMINHIDDIKKHGIDNVGLYEELSDEKARDIQDKLSFHGAITITIGGFIDGVVASSGDSFKDIIDCISGASTYYEVIESLEMLSDKSVSKATRNNIEQKLKRLKDNILAAQQMYVNYPSPKGNGLLANNSPD